MLVKVKEPLESEYALMRENQLAYTYFRFAADKLWFSVKCNAQNFEPQSQKRFGHAKYFSFFSFFCLFNVSSIKKVRELHA
jgi:hypothetical protein